MRHFATTHCRLAMVALIVLVASGLAGAAAFPYTGVVTGSDVYVRSGPDQNWYPVMKLNQGQRVTVLGESHGWLMIAPPTGAFSLIDSQYVQRQNGTGFVTADRVFVRAGSLLQPQQRSAAQTKLSRGDRVTILGEEDGYYRIAPPEGTSLYISSRYVRPEGEAGDILAQATRPAGAGTAAATQPGAGIIIRESRRVQRPAPGGAAATTTAPAGQGEWQQQLAAVEEAAQQELTKPLSQRNWQPLIARYQALAGQSADRVTAEIARARVEHLMVLAQAQRTYDIAAQTDEIVRTELELMDRPAPQMPPTEPPSGFDARGILKASYVFSGVNTPKLYRLVNPATDTAVAYVQETTDLAAKMAGLVGQYVGVRAAQQTFRPDWSVNLIVPAAVEELDGEDIPATRPMEAGPRGAPAADPAEPEAGGDAAEPANP